MNLPLIFNPTTRPQLWVSKENWVDHPEGFYYDVVSKELFQIDSSPYVKYIGWVKETDKQMELL